MPDFIDRYAVIPTRNRPWNVFYRSFEAAINEGAYVIIVNNGDNSVFADDPSANDCEENWVEIMAEPENPVNLSKLWNIGLDSAALLASEIRSDRWDVAILNDDCIVPKGWFDAVSGAMREMKAAAGCSGGRGPLRILQTHAGPVPLDTRMQGFAFMLRGEVGVRANEQLKWYFGDDHIDWMSRKLGGMVMIPGFHVEHLHPNGQMTAELHEQTGRDAQAFQAYWGARPW